jgi:nicotinamide riboside transporter PnuC
MAAFDSWVSNPKESHGPLMSVVTWSLVAVAGTFLIVRLFIRQHQRKLWLDDCTLVISWVSATISRGKEHLTHILQVLLLIQVTINQLSINIGYGKHTLDRKTPKESRISHTTDC